MGFKDKFNDIESFGLDYIFGNDDEAMAFADAENIEDAFIKLQEKSYIFNNYYGRRRQFGVVTNDEIINTPKC